MLQGFKKVEQAACRKAGESANTLWRKAVPWEFSGILEKVSLLLSGEKIRDKRQSPCFY